MKNVAEHIILGIYLCRNNIKHEFLHTAILLISKRFYPISIDSIKDKVI